MSSSQLTHIEDARLEWNPEDKGPDSLLGKGAFGSVYRGTLDFTEVAIKVITRAASDSHEHELRLMKHLIHPNIVQFLGAACNPLTAETVIVTELLNGGSLHKSLELMREHTPDGHGGAVVEERSFLRIGANIANGLLYLHNSRYTHGDMKPHNVLLNSPVEFTGPDGSAVFQRNVHAKIADFGLSRSIGRKTDDLMATTNTPDFGPGPVGTFAYMAPQAFDGIQAMSGDIAKAADVYAFAIVFFELLTGRQPWKAENVVSVFNLYCLVCNEARRPTWGPREESIRPEYMDFVKKCWAQKWEDRPTSEAVAKQFREWIADFKRRESAVSPGFSAGSPSTASPPVQGAEGNGGEDPAFPAAAPPQGNGVDSKNGRGVNFLDDSLGTSENGTPFKRIQTEILDEEQALEARKPLEARMPLAARKALHFDPLDIGGSTDTLLRESNSGIPPAPESEEYDAPLPAAAAATSSPPSRFMQDPIKSGLNLLETAAFNDYVKRVETHVVPLPEIDLDIPLPGVPSAGVEEKKGMGLNLGLMLPSNEPNQGDVGFLGNGAGATPGEKDNLASSFFQAAAQYGSAHESSEVSNPTLEVASSAKPPVPMGLFDPGGPNFEAHDSRKNKGNQGEMADSFFRAAAEYDQGVSADSPGWSGGLNVGTQEPKKNRTDLNSMADSFMRAAQNYDKVLDSKSPVQSSGLNVETGEGGNPRKSLESMNDSFMRAAENYGKAIDSNSPAQPGGLHAATQETRKPKESLESMNDSFMRAAENYDKVLDAKSPMRPSLPLEPRKGRVSLEGKNASISPAQQGHPGLNVSPRRTAQVSTELPSMKIELPRVSAVQSQQLDWGGVDLGCEVSINDVSSKVEARTELVSGPTAVAPGPPEHPFFAPPPVSTVSPPHHGRHGLASMNYQSAPVFPGYTQSLNVVGAATMPDPRWYTDPRTTIGGNHMSANPAPIWNVALPVAPLSVKDAVRVLLRSDAGQALQYWEAGHHKVLGMAFVQAASNAAVGFSGNGLLELALEVIKRNNQHPREPLVARDLCVAVGLIATKGDRTFGPRTVADALPVVVSVMHFYQRNLGVYSSSSYALSNLLKISNTVDDPRLREVIADWIMHTLTCSVSGPEKLDSLAYTSLCAARNFMWLSEANTVAFLGKGWANPSPLRRLLGALSEFRDKEKVLEAGLGALAMIVYSPAHRARVVTDDGVSVLLTLAQHALQRPRSACVCLSTLSVLVEPAAGSSAGDGSSAERAAVRDALLRSKAAGVVLRVLHFAMTQRLQRRDLALLPLQEQALATLSALCACDPDVRASAVEHKAPWLLAEALHGCAGAPASPAVGARVAVLVVQTCEAALVLAQSEPGAAALRDRDFLRLLEAVRAVYADHEQLAYAAAQVAAALATDAPPPG